MTTTTTSDPRTAAALAARRRDSQAALDRVTTAITLLHRQRLPISTAAVARHAKVSRTFIYTNSIARAAVDAAKSQAGQNNSVTIGEHKDAGWRERALNAESGLKNATAEIVAHRDRIGELLGRIRDIEAEWTEEAIGRITTDNASLKQRVRQLTADNRALEEKLTAARSNLRFQDRRIADLEAQLLDRTTPR